MEYVLWATRIGQEDWQEELITSTESTEHLERARKWALANGFDRLRVMWYRGEKPNFTNTIRGAT